MATSSALVPVTGDSENSAALVEHTPKEQQHRHERQHRRKHRQRTPEETAARATLANGGSVTLVQVAPAAAAAVSTGTRYLHTGTHEGYCYHCKRAVLRAREDRAGELPESFAFCSLRCPQRLVMHRECMNELVWKRGPDFDLSVPCTNCGSSLVARLECRSVSEILTDAVSRILCCVRLPLRIAKRLVYVMLLCLALVAVVYVSGWVYKLHHYYWVESSDVRSVRSFLDYRFVLNDAGSGRTFVPVRLLRGVVSQTKTGHWHDWPANETVSTGVWPTRAHFAIGQGLFGGWFLPWATAAYGAWQVLRFCYQRVRYRARYVVRH